MRDNEHTTTETRTITVTADTSVIEKAISEAFKTHAANLKAKIHADPGEFTPTDAAYLWAASLAEAEANRREHTAHAADALKGCDP